MAARQLQHLHMENKQPNMDIPHLTALPIPTMLSSEQKSNYDYNLSDVESPLSFENNIENEVVQPKSHTPPSFSTLMIPAILICIPMIVLSAVLLAVVFGYQIRPQANIFGVISEPEDYYRLNYLLVDFSDTKIVFLASFLSTIAPLLAGCVMTIASVKLLSSLRGEISTNSTISPSDPDQEHLLNGLVVAGYRHLFKSLKFAFLNRGKRGHAAITYATLLLLLTVFMSTAVTVADAVLHMLTHTVEFRSYATPSTPDAEHGRGLNTLCTNFDRIQQNYGWPCTSSHNTDFRNPNLSADLSEQQNLAHNTSQSLEVQYSTYFEPDGGNVEMAYLIPRRTTIEAGLSYEAQTIGASAKCSIVPATICNLTRWGPGPNQLYTSFNCSNMFWGSIGLPEEQPTLDQLRKSSPYLSFQSFKPQPNLQYSFFSDRSLETVYNPAGLNHSGWRDTNLPQIPDDQLPSSIYMAFALRTSMMAFTGNKTHEMYNNTQTSRHPNKTFVDYFLRCEVSSYNVDFVWNGGDVQSVAAKPINNGTLLNMWQGTTLYGPTVSGGDHTFQDFCDQAALAGNTMESYEKKFGELLSQKVIATIGAYTSSRTVLRQQSWQSQLLAQVPKGALGSLVACSLLYPILGLFLLFQARNSLRHNQIINAPTTEKIQTTPIPWYQYQNQLPPQPQLDIPRYTSSRNHTKLAIVGDRRSTAGFRFALWGDAGVGPNFNHLRSNHSAGRGDHSF